PGTSICPYHYEYGDEEWLVVLEGTASVRHPDGQDALARGDVVCFPAGPAGAHKVTNRSGERLRVLMLSSKSPVSVAVYPDSDKIGVFPGNEGDTVMFRRDSGVGYWDGETGDDGR
ncbi:MAG TPA: cupin domain-containing protein, partial [Gemmatimonadaceae bacterium]|nr:cupin domain-containing protein [Gemmatimonadaceae bacterium]